MKPKYISHQCFTSVLIVRHSLFEHLTPYIPENTQTKGTKDIKLRKFVQAKRTLTQECSFKLRLKTHSVLIITFMASRHCKYVQK